MTENLFWHGFGWGFFIAALFFLSLFQIIRRKQKELSKRIDYLIKEIHGN
jgi:hypothetical protein